MNQSETIGQLALALSKVQGKLTHAKKDSNNPFFNSSYADLGSVLDSCRGLLAENELSIMQFPGDIIRTEDGFLAMQLTTILAHSSGEWIGKEMEMPISKPDPQGTGSCLTYMRRYSLAAVLGIYAGGDDDGNAATLPTKNKRITINEI